MFREMRRSRQALPEAESLAILERGSHGVLAVLGDEGYPYAVPLNYVYEGGAIYFHCARSGHKYDAVKACPHASFCVIDRSDVVPETYSTDYRSVIVFGEVSELTNEAEKRHAIERLALRFAPDDSAEHRAAAIDGDWDALCVLVLRIEHLSGKEAMALAKAQRGE